jgi:hypothetical protein
MIISHTRRFVFVKTTKTAGTSVEIALSRYCGADDIITPILPDDEAIRTAEGIRGPQNFVVTREDGAELKFNNHSPGVRARKLLGAAGWNAYFTFAFERNPFDRLVSAYHYMQKNRTDRGEWDEAMTFGKFARNEARLSKLHQSGWGLYTDNDEIIVDKIYKFEELDDSIADIYRNIGVESGMTLPKTKTSKRKAGYREYYDDESRKVVERIFAKELATFEYSF